MKLNSEQMLNDLRQPILHKTHCYMQGGLELNRIYNESNLETMKRMPDNFIDLTVTSPPYDNLRDYKGYSFEFEEVAKELYRVTKPGGVVVWVVGDSTKDGSESGTSLRQALYFMQVKFRLHDTMIYAKNNYIPLTHNRYEQQFEFMYVFSKSKLKTFNPIKKINKQIGAIKGGNFRQNKDEKGNRHKDVGVKKHSISPNIWYYDVGMNNSTKDEEAFKHPAIFPEQLAADHIYSWSNEGDLVYDCFGGSGTVAKMAHLQKRNWILSEISSDYCQIAEKRIAPYLSQTSLF